MPKILLTLFLFLLTNSGSLFASKLCTYQTYQWSPSLQKAVNIHRIQHPYSELTAAEIDNKTGCSVCQEDQRTIKLSDKLSITVCARIANRIAPTLITLMEQGELILSVTGYRVGMTKGLLNAEGLRTQFSNHSFGTAIDINRQYNGLYDRCLHFSPNCRLT